MDAGYSFAKDVFAGIWHQTAPAINHWRHFKDNIKKLQDQLECLQIEANSVKSIIDTAVKEEGKVATEKVRLWLDNVTKAKDEAEGILRKNSVKTALRNDASKEEENEEEEEPKKTTCVNGIFFFARINISEMAVEKCRGLMDLIDKRPPDDALVRSPPPATVVVRPYRILAGGGAKEFMEEVWKPLVEEEGWKMIGVYGQAKVGKTALVENINHKLGKAEKRFDKVIWSSLKLETKGNNTEIQEERMDQEEQQVRMAISKVQDDIASRFRSLELHGDEKNRAQIVFDRLRDLKFALILDHVEYALDLNRIGVPDKNNTVKGSKVVIITRDYNICTQMGVDNEFEVKCLVDAEAWKLFRQIAWPKRKLSDDDDVDGIPESVVKTAKELTRHCGGLPGEIVTIAQLMKHNRNEDDWIETLKKYEQSKGNKMHSTGSGDEIDERGKKEEEIPIWFWLAFGIFFLLWGLVICVKKLLQAINQALRGSAAAIVKFFVGCKHFS